MEELNKQLIDKLFKQDQRIKQLERILFEFVEILNNDSAIDYKTHSCAFDSVLALKEIIKNNKTAEELYQQECFTFPGLQNYQPILNEFGKIVIQVDTSTSKRVIYKKENYYGYLAVFTGDTNFSSQLQKCETYEEVDKLMFDLYFKIDWLDSIFGLDKLCVLETFIGNKQQKGFWKKVTNYCEQITGEIK